MKDNRNVTDLLNEWGIDEAKAAGKAQQALMDNMSGEWQALNDLTKRKDFVGIHYAKIQSAAEALEKKKLIQTKDGGKSQGLMVKLAESIEEEKLDEAKLDPKAKFKISFFGLADKNSFGDDPAKTIALALENLAKKIKSKGLPKDEMIRNKNGDSIGNAEIY